MDKPDYLDRKLGILTAHSQVPSTEVNPQGLGMLTHTLGGPGTVCSFHTWGTCRGAGQECVCSFDWLSLPTHTRNDVPVDDILEFYSHI